MKRIIITAGAALLVAVPASVGFISNASALGAPVRVPSQAVVMDDNGGQRNHVQAGDDKGGLRRHIESGDDKGGLHGGDDGPQHS